MFYSNEFNSARSIQLNDTVEVFLTVAEFPHYQVSNLGRVRSFKRGVPTLLTLTPSTSGYLQVKFWDEGKG